MLMQVISALIDVEILDRQIIVKIDGAIDNQKVIVDMIKLLEENTGKFEFIQIDITDVEFVNTFFINGLVRIKRQFATPVSLTGVNPSVRELLDISNISRVIPISPN